LLTKRADKKHARLIQRHIVNEEAEIAQRHSHLVQAVEIGCRHRCCRRSVENEADYPPGQEAVV
jgi:hypothetical protein